MAKENKCERLRFNVADDLYLLREVVEQNPFEDPCKWEIIRSNIVLMTSKNFSKRTLKEHVEYLLKLFSKEDWQYKKRSGTAEQYAEKVTLLQNITDLVRNFKNKPDGVKQSTKNDKFQGLMLHEFATSSCSINSNQDADIYYLDTYANTSGGTQVPQMDEERDLEILENETLPNINEQQETINCALNLSNSEDFDIQNSSYLRKKRKSLLQEPAPKCSENKHEMDFKRKKMELEERTLTLEERTVSLDEAKFGIHKKERLQQLELDYREKEAHFSIIKQQQELLSLFLLENKRTLDLNLKTKQIELEEKKLNLEERKISLEEAKFEIEKMERLQRLELDAREKEAHIYIIKQQQELMSLFLLDNKSA